jgi:hypothetical protein
VVVELITAGVIGVVAPGLFGAPFGALVLTPGLAGGVALGTSQAAESV